jgi:hypothetical protein
LRTSLAILSLLGCGIGLGQLVAADEPINQPPAGFTALFNGQDLSGWYGMKSASPYVLAEMSAEDRAKKKTDDTEDAFKHWSVENGELVNDGDGAFLTTEKDYGDIELIIEYKTVPKADSGIYLRGTPQVQIWDYTEQDKFAIGADKGSGGLWNNSAENPGKNPLVLADKPFGEWNRFFIRQIGARTTIYLNGKLVVDNAVLENYWDGKRPLVATGPIQLQTHGGEIRWRNLFVREIPPQEANLLLQHRDEEGFVCLFNGRDLTGWQGAVDNYEVVEGAIRCKPHLGGTLYTADKYADFVARLEFRLPVAGNNGLAIRYPGEGDPAYAGMCELQVLDAGYPGRLDPRQVHGSAYGMVPAHVGYLRPAGCWNYQEVTVLGSKITVELNGTIILQGDLSEVKELMANSPHPGKDLTEGYFGFAGHSDPCEFRNIRIKRLQ